MVEMALEFPPSENPPVEKKVDFLQSEKTPIFLQEASWQSLGFSEFPEPTNLTY